MSTLVSVAVPVPQVGLLTYRVPDGWPVPPVGARVLAPLGSRKVTGCVTAQQADAPPDGAVRDLLDLLDDEPFLPVEVIRLVLWVAEYYMAAPGEAVAAAMPPLAWLASRREVRITPRGLAERERLHGLRRRLLDRLAHGR
ncbi:MAG TPA: hypothetical protein VNI83_03125, partial [Vicinamibacterales bacterium]|nr:hypothetical protein [Vicinamibacterales bacterium]